MKDETFKRRLIDFFERHDKGNLGLVDPIAGQFEGKEEDVFATLNKFYTGKKSGVPREDISKELGVKTPIMGDSKPPKL